MRLNIALSIVALAVVVSLATATQARACSCVEPNESFVRGSDGAVIAKLIEVTPLADEVGKADFAYRIQRVFKGKRRIEVGQVLTVRSSLSEASCGLPQSPDKRQGLFLDRRAHNWTSSLCQLVSPVEMKKLIAQAASAQPASGQPAGSGCS